MVNVIRVTMVKFGSHFIQRTNSDLIIWIKNARTYLGMAVDFFKIKIMLLFN